ncbi:MAG: hypothetical protein KAZ87_04740 [Spirochaetes bacterium]|nr:hypothetical protein [Spirochaetota bacterium]
MRFFRYITLFLLCFAGFFPRLDAQKAASSTRAGVQRFAQKGLKDNRYYIYYINSTITNFGSEEDRTKFEGIIRRDILCQVMYLKFDFRAAYRQIRKNQKDLIELYLKKLDDEEISVKALLDEFAPLAVNSGDAKSKHYLKLGYRELASAKIEATMADNYKPLLYSLRLHKYSRAMKRLKEAKRYAFLARIQPHLTREEKIKEKILSFEEILAKIDSFSEGVEREKFKLIHYDSYYKTPVQSSIVDSVWGDKEFSKRMHADYAEEAK